MLRNKLVLAFSLSALLFFIGCEDDDSPLDSTPAKSAAFTVTIQNVSEVFPFIQSGVFNTPVGESSPGPLFPGNTYEAEFSATPGMKLSFATMFVQSNDFFYAPDVNGISLFDNSGNQITGDITSQIMLWDAGTEINQEPGLGADQAPSQSGANTGASDPNNTVRLATDDFNNLPAVTDVVKITLTSTSATGFKLIIENVSTSTTLLTSDANTHPVPLAPGVFVVHSGTNPLFNVSSADFGMGLEAVAEDGNPEMLISELSKQTGLTGPFAPGAWAVYTSNNPIFTEGQSDNTGLEGLAEDGNPGNLESSLNSNSDVKSAGVFNTPVGSGGAAPIFPGEEYQFTFTAEENDLLAFATMLVQSNDIFASPSAMGLSLFDSQGNAVMGDITSQLIFWDAGTEVNEFPGVGLNQAPRQSGANTGTTENGTVRKLSNVNDGFDYPALNTVLKITIEAQEVN